MCVYMYICILPPIDPSICIDHSIVFIFISLLHHAVRVNCFPSFLHVAR